jgi:hypothetical protein
VSAGVGDFEMGFDMILVGAKAVSASEVRLYHSPCQHITSHSGIMFLFGTHSHI